MASHFADLPKKMLQWPAKKLCILYWLGFFIISPYREYKDIVFLEGHIFPQSFHPNQFRQVAAPSCLSLMEKNGRMANALSYQQTH